MRKLYKNFALALAAFGWVTLFASVLLAQTRAGSLNGQVNDQTGLPIPGITVTLTGPGGTELVAQTNEEGKYVFHNLPAGTYSVRVELKGFGTFEKTGIVIAPGKPEVVDARMEVSLEKQQVTVQEQTQGVSTNADSNASQLVLRGADLNALSDDPDELSDELAALAGPSAGPNGGQIYIDGFTGGTLPPKSSILEIIVNQSPFSAEYDRLGFGRIQIITKPGSDKFHGMGFFNFGDSVFNSRNPFSPTRPSYSTKMGEANVGGPMGKKASFFFDFERRNIGQAAVISAVTLDNAFNIVPFSDSILDPNHRTELGPRFDFQLTPKNTMTVRYRWEGGGQDNAGLSAFTLPSQAYNRTNTEQTFQLTETALLSARTVNNFHFQWNGEANNNVGTTPGATISVLGAFTGGGSSNILNNVNQDNYEFQNITRMSLGNHQVEFGGRLRNSNFWENSQGGYNGAFTFNSIEAYQLTAMGMANGLTPAQIAAQGGGPSQFTLTAGTPVASISQYDLGIFAQDDWKMKPNFTLSYGLRYETQNQISDHSDIAPRIGFAWGLGGKGSRPKTVIRAGAGIFYDRFGQNLTLQALRLNGVHQQQFVIPNPDFFPTVPSSDSLEANLSPQTIYTVQPDVRTPYVFQEAIGIERQLPKNITVAVTYTNSHGVHQLRARDINAPLPDGTRPFGGTQNIFQYESGGIFNQAQLITNINARVSPRFSMFGFYTLNSAHSNTDGSGDFPANQYDLSSEYGPASFNVRHRVFLGGSIAGPLGTRFSPFMSASSGRPFDITIGQDIYGDSLYNARPAFAAAGATGPDIVATPFGTFNLAPGPSDTIIPRNYAVGPGQFSLNMRFAKTFNFGGEKSSSTGDSGGYRGGGRHGGGGPGGGLGPGGLSGGGGGMRGMFGSNANKRYSLEFSIFARNLLNTTNLGSPVGNLSSPLFGHSNSSAGGFFSSSANRMFQAGLRFTF
jgi:Carboxypeptidase regulatory-like domain/TonB dependent receptor-like, beta-barrel